VGEAGLRSQRAGGLRVVGLVVGRRVQSLWVVERALLGAEAWVWSRMLAVGVVGRRVRARSCLLPGWERNLLRRDSVHSHPQWDRAHNSLHQAEERLVSHRAVGHLHIQEQGWAQHQAQARSGCCWTAQWTEAGYTVMPRAVSTARSAATQSSVTNPWAHTRSPPRTTAGSSPAAASFQP
jgi:hypothetical protein